MISIRKIIPLKHPDTTYTSKHAVTIGNETYTTGGICFVPKIAKLFQREHIGDNIVVDRFFLYVDEKHIFPIYTKLYDIVEHSVLLYKKGICDARNYLNNTNNTLTYIDELLIDNLHKSLMQELVPYDEQISDYISDMVRAASARASYLSGPNTILSSGYGYWNNIVGRAKEGLASCIEDSSYTVNDSISSAFYLVTPMLPVFYNEVAFDRLTYKSMITDIQYRDLNYSTTRPRRCMIEEYDTQKYRPVVDFDETMHELCAVLLSSPAEVKYNYILQPKYRYVKCEGDTSYPVRANKFHTKQYENIVKNTLAKLPYKTADITIRKNTYDEVVITGTIDGKKVSKYLDLLLITLTTITGVEHRGLQCNISKPTTEYWGIRTNK